METRLRALLIELKPAILWAVGALIGLMILITENFLLGLVIFAGCAYMTKAALARGAVSNISALQKEVASIAANKFRQISNSTTTLDPEMDEETFKRNLAAAVSDWTKGDRNLAADKLEAALNMRPRESEGWFLLGKWTDSLSAPELLEQGDRPNVQRSVRALERATELDPKQVEAFALLSDVYRSFDFRLALKACRRAAELDPKYTNECVALEKIVEEDTVTLSKLNLIMLPSTRTEPTNRILETIVHFGENSLQSAVCHTCVNGSNSKTMHGWLFLQEKPDLWSNRPVASFEMWDSPKQPFVHCSVTGPGNFDDIMKILRKQNFV